MWNKLFDVTGIQLIWSHYDLATGLWQKGGRHKIQTATRGKTQNDRQWKSQLTYEATVNINIEHIYVNYVN